MRRFYNILITILSFVALLNAGTDGTIRGKITDDQGAPLPGANIYVPDVGTGCLLYTSPSPRD